ncbi:MAG TPA: Ig-like domain-containing protein [Thermoanaerobaculia bacterium]|nr:Ig-like domain-containing protein [Thermoanaerobaculia bacterium]
MMWRWVTRGLVLTILLALFVPALVAQGFIGAVDLPDPAVTQFGEVVVKGWVLDQQAVSRIELYVDDQFQSNANMNLPRIDVIEANPTWPGVQNSAPGFQTAFNAARFANGAHTIYVKVFTSDSQVNELGRRTIVIDNTINQAPFGSVDVPDLAGVYNASGSFPVVGWALDTDGIGRIDVLIDNGIVQSALYGDERPDVANTFPDLPSAAFSGFIANVDTTRIQDGVHQLTVRATDRVGLSSVIGRRTVQIFNSESNLKPFGYLDTPLRDSVLFGTFCGTIPVISPVVNPRAHITPVRGWALDLGTRGSNVGRVSYVELLVDGVPWYTTDDCSFSASFNAFINCYGLPRYDVERMFPNYPDAPRAGFMFTLDVGGLLALGVRQGSHVLKVRVGDQQQTFSELPNRDGIPVFFTCAEVNQDFAAVGFIEVPTSFDFVKGNVTFQGWAFDENGGVVAVEMIVDGDFEGVAQYGFTRTDVQQAYPFIFNSINSGWRFTMDTTKLSNARHRLTVRVLDFQGNRSEIGSVDFYVQNANVTP